MDVPNMLVLYWLHAKFLVLSSKREIVNPGEFNPNLGSKQLTDSETNMLSDEGK